MRVMIICVLLLLVTSNSVSAEMTVNIYKANKDKQAMQLYILGLFHGYGWANAFLIREGKSPVYCEPEKLQFELEDLIYILDREIKAAEEENKLKPDMPIGLFLLIGLCKDFRCKK
ncbi:MAG: hypothetical protein ACFFCW_37770 [Candidatus Hodarchaeota archaeon]